MVEYEKEHEQPLPKEMRKATKWTAGATSAVRYEGWGTEGLQAYNMMVKKVREDRAARGDEFDKYFLDYKKEEDERLRNQGKKRRRVGGQDDEVTRVDIENDAGILSDMEEDEEQEATSVLGV